MSGNFSAGLVTFLSSQTGCLVKFFIEIYALVLFSVASVCCCFFVSVMSQFFTKYIQDTSTKLSGIICRPPQQIKFDYHDSNSLPVALRMGWPLRSPQMWASGRCNSAKISSSISIIGDDYNIAMLLPFLFTSNSFSLHCLGLQQQRVTRSWDQTKTWRSHREGM